jgi:hypothetical protein
MQASHQRKKCGLGQFVDLIEGNAHRLILGLVNHDGEVLQRRAYSPTPWPLLDRPLGIDDKAHGLNILDAIHREGHHGPVDARLRKVNARRVDKNRLHALLGIDPRDAISGGLWLVRCNCDLLPEKPVEQRALPSVRPPNDGDAPVAVFVHVCPLRPLAHHRTTKTKIVPLKNIKNTPIGSSLGFTFASDHAHRTPFKRWVRHKLEGLQAKMGLGGPPVDV